MNAHRHDFTPGAGHNRPPCPICSGEEGEDALVEALAEKLWENRPGCRIDYTPWHDVVPYWREAFHEYARASLRCMRELAHA